MLLKDILTAKGKNVLTIRADAMLSDVVRELVKHNVGSLIVCDGEKIVGIITERDILRAVAEVDCQLGEIPIARRMSVNVITGCPGDDVEAVMGIMTERRIRHLPVLDQGQLAGLVSIGDVVKSHHAQVAMEHKQLLNYIQS